MGNRDFDIDLKMNLESAQAARQLQAREGDLKRIAQAAASANAEISGVTQGPAAPTPTGAAGAAQAETAATDALNASLQRNAHARDAIANTSRVVSNAAAAEIGLIGELQTRLDRGANSFDDLADTEARLDAAMQKGLISTEEYDQALEQLNIEQERLERQSAKTGKEIDTTVGRYDRAGAGLKRLAQDEQRLKAAVDAGRISREQYNRALAGIGAERTRLTALREGATNAAVAMRGLNLQSLSTQQNLAQLVRSGVTGQWQVAGSQLLSLGSRAGAVGVAFSAAGVAILGATGLFAGFGIAAVQGYLQTRALEQALIATGNAAGATAGELADIRNEVGSASGEYAKAQTALVALAGSGQLVEDSLALAATAAVNLSELTGRSIEDTTNQIISLAKAPSATLLELNDKYHFLTTGVYDNVKSLELQGRTLDATRVAMDALATVTSDRVDEMRSKAGTLERAWEAVKNKVEAAWQAAKDYGREDPEGRIAALSKEIARLQALPFPDKFPLRRQRIQDLEKEIELARQARDAEKLRAKEEAQTAAEQSAGSKAQEQIQRDLEANANREAQKRKELLELEREINAVRATGATQINGQTLAQIEAIRRAQIEEKYKPPKDAKGPKAQDPDADAKREIANLTTQLAMLNLVGDAEQKVGESARVRYEIENGAFKGASDNAKRQLQTAADQLEQRQREIQLAKDLKAVDLEILKQQGQDVAAALQLALDGLKKLRAEAAAAGNTDGVAKVDQLIGLTQARSQLDQLRTQYDQITGNVQQKLQRISAEREAGLITEYEAQRRIVAAYREEGTVLDTLLPKMEALAIAIGDPVMIENVRRLRAEFEQTQMHVDLLQQQVGNIFKGAFSNALTALADRTKTLGQAVRGFFADMARGLAQLAANNLAEAAWTKLQGLFNKDKGNGKDLKGDASALSAASIPWFQVIIGLNASAAALSAAAIAAGASGGGSGDSSSGSYGDLISGIVSSFFAEGGEVSGPGTGTSDSILARISDGEFIHRAAVVAQPGALAFLHDFNNRGMPAIEDWARRFDGVEFPRSSLPSMPRFHFADGGLAQAAGSLMPQVNLRNVNVFDIEELAERLATSPAFERTNHNYVTRNASFIRGATEGA
jgi:hypothetical protein